MLSKAILRNRSTHFQKYKYIRMALYGKAKLSIITLVALTDGSLGYWKVYILYVASYKGDDYEAL